MRLNFRVQFRFRNLFLHHLLRDCSDCEVATGSMVRAELDASSPLIRGRQSTGQYDGKQQDAQEKDKVEQPAPTVAPPLRHAR